MNDNFELERKYEKFAIGYNDNLYEIDRFIGFLDLSDKDKLMAEKGIKILTDKFKKIKKAESLKEAKKYVKLKRIDSQYE